MKRNTKDLLVRMPVHYITDLSLLSKDFGVPRSVVIREALLRYLERHEPQLQRIKNKDKELIPM